MFRVLTIRQRILQFNTLRTSRLYQRHGNAARKAKVTSAPNFSIQILSDEHNYSCVVVTRFCFANRSYTDSFSRMFSLKKLYNDKVNEFCFTATLLFVSLSNLTSKKSLSLHDLFDEGGSLSHEPFS